MDENSVEHCLKSWATSVIHQIPPPGGEEVTG